MVLRGRWCLIPILSFILVSGSALTAGACGLDWNGPMNFSYGIGENGNVSVIRELGKLRLKSEEIPLLMIFDSRKRTDSPRTGAFRIPLLESSLWAEDESNYLLYTPSGDQWHFRRLKANSPIWEGPYGFKMEIVGDVATIRAECGIKLVYVRGRISQIQIKEATLDYVYSGSAVSEIRRDGAPLLKVENEPNSSRIRRLSLAGGESVQFSWGKRPVVGKQGGVPVIDRIGDTVTGILKSDGETESYSFDLSNDLTPRLVLNGKSLFEWNTSGDLTRADDDTYEVVKNPERPTAFQISRVLPDGKKETSIFDGKGQKQVFEYPDGRKIERLYFASGALNGKLRQEIETLPSGELNIKEKNSYDDKGRILRQTRGSHSVFFDYDEKTTLVTARDEASNILWTKERLSDGTTKVNFSDGKFVTIKKVSDTEMTVSVTRNGRTIVAKRTLDDNFVVETPTK